VSDVPSKERLKEELTKLLASDLATRERAHKAAREGATHEEAKPENDKDTRALEASYLARGEAVRVEEIRASLAEVQSMQLRATREGEPVALGAIVLAEENGESLILWLAPHGGGNRLADGAVQIVTPKSPLGRALIGKRAGDECEVRLAGRNRVLTIERVE
jgi:transcription elongation GreA/GreB family factor